MKCKNRFCVFNRKNNECVRKNVHLNESGCCMDVFYPTYLKGLPDNEKEKFFNVPRGQGGKIYEIENIKYFERQRKKSQ